MNKAPTRFKEYDLQRMVGNLLRWGVITAILIVGAGLFLYLFQEGKGTVNYAEFNPLRFQGFAALCKGLLNADYHAVIQLGVMLLIATPIVRVLIALIGFALEKDRLYVVISLIILAVILFSIIYGYAA